MPLRLLLLGLVLRAVARRTKRDRQAVDRELSLRLDGVGFLLCQSVRTLPSCPPGWITSGSLCLRSGSRGARQTGY